MPKMSKEELKRRKVELGKQARAELAKTEVMRFRLDPNNILRLYELAEKKRQNVGAMVRQWVLDRMEEESKSKTSRVSKSSEDHHSQFDAILHRLDFLETKINRLSVHK